MAGSLLLPRPQTRTLRWPGGSARLGPWRGHDDVAALTLAAHRAPSIDIVSRGLDWLRAAGYTTVVTNALSPADALPFVDSGFAVREQLHLLAHNLEAIPRRNHRSHRVSKRGHRDVLALDHRCFDDFWRFDPTGLNDALTATPYRRFRIGTHHRKVAAYAITGRAGNQGYIQRIGVDPNLRRSGWGTALVADALQWLRRRGVQRALVNTQLENEGALHLYERCGFRLLPAKLCVLERPL